MSKKIFTLQVLFGRRMHVVIFALFSLFAPLATFFLSSFNKDVPHTKFKFERFSFLSHIPEPSDIVYDKDSKHFFIVSDHGMLFECDLEGKIIRKATEGGLDFEGVEVTDSFIYVSDETPRVIYKYLKSDLSLLKTYNVTWGGGINKAFESITYNETKKCFVLVSEAPVVIIEYDDHFKEKDRYPFHATRDVSGARWYKGAMYLVGDKDRVIIKCDPTTYAVLEYYNIDVLNPEGLTFDAYGNMSMTSDDLQRIYFFKNLPILNNKTK